MIKGENDAWIDWLIGNWGMYRMNTHKQEREGIIAMMKIRFKKLSRFISIRQRYQIVQYDLLKRLKAMVILIEMN